MTVAEVLAPLVRAAVGRDAPLRSEVGTEAGWAPNAQWAEKINNRKGLRRLLWAPNKLGFARAYVSGDIEIEENLLEGMEALERCRIRRAARGVRIDAETKKAVVKAALRLGIIGPPPKPPPTPKKPNSPAGTGTASVATPEQ